MTRDAAWLATLQPGPANNAPADDVDYAHATAGRVPVWADLDLPGGRRQVPAITTSWTREHVRVEARVPDRGTMLLWLPAADITRRDDD